MLARRPSWQLLSARRAEHDSRWWCALVWARRACVCVSTDYARVACSETADSVAFRSLTDKMCRYDCNVTGTILEDTNSRSKQSTSDTTCTRGAACGAATVKSTCSGSPTSTVVAYDAATLRSTPTLTFSSTLYELTLPMG